MYLKDAGLAFAVALTGWEPNRPEGSAYFGGNMIPDYRRARIVLRRLDDDSQVDLDVNLIYDYKDGDVRYVRHGHHLVFGILFGRVLEVEHVPELGWEY